MHLYSPSRNVHFVKEINRTSFSFIWEGKPAKVKRRTIIREKKHGGLKMLDLEIMDKALKVVWIERLKTHSSASWKIIPELGVKQYGGLTFLIKCQYDTKMLSFDNLLDFCRLLLSNCSNWKIYCDDHITLSESKATCPLPLYLLAAKKKAIIVSFR